MITIITPKMFKVTALLSLLKRAPDSISMVILANCDLELSYALVNTFNICL